MTRKNDSKSPKNQQEKTIEKALKTGGFIFPQTVDEVKEFERIYGMTDIILPAELQSPTFLDSISQKSNSGKVVKFPNENFAMAARDGSATLPSNIRLKIVSDIKQSENKNRRKGR